MDAMELTGVVLLTQPVGEYDKRLVILTREMGKITAFAHGARRAGNPLMAACNPFVFGTFEVVQGRNAYTLRKVNAANYFTELAAAQPGVYYGFYFLELASYFSAEGMEASEMVNLLYISLRAILKGAVPLPFMRKVYECRIMAENGVFAPPEEAGKMDPDAWYALRFTAGCKVAELYSFRLKEEAEADYGRYVKQMLGKTVDRKLMSEDLLDMMLL
ncbi:MAG: DNA repair protein RecO [Lachnospiraceae bacterium]|nr:DNA repair protein RecO [Lachnospiraceae bacterium]